MNYKEAMNACSDGKKVTIQNNPTFYVYFAEDLLEIRRVNFDSIGGRYETCFIPSRFEEKSVWIVYTEESPILKFIKKWGLKFTKLFSKNPLPNPA